MKKLVLLATAAAVLASVPATGSAANIKSILNRSQTVTYQGVKLPEGVTMYQNNPKAAPVKRLCLHAYELFLADCTHPERPKSFIAQIPDDLAVYINPAWLKQTD